MQLPVEAWAIIGLSGALVLVLLAAVRLQGQLSRERHRSRSQSSRYGRMTEQFLPLADSYPWDPSNFRFLGSPVDGIQFEEDRVVIVEFKAGSSDLSKRQRRIRDLVRNGRVDFEVIRLRRP